MALEIERKFLVTDGSFADSAICSRSISQGYLNREPERTVRVRLCDGRGYLTVKTRNCGATRHEWEYEIPAADARAMLGACGGVIEKTRYIVPAAEDGLKWEVDVFHGRHEGLVVAEIELPTEDTPFTLPPFIGREVTGDPRYYNSNLSLEFRV